MKERGFMPFTAAGALIVLIVLGVISHAAWSRHQRSLGTVDDISDSALLATAAGIQSDIKAAMKYSVYRALWEVSKQADSYNDGARENAIEQLATAYFAERLAEIGPAYARYDARVELDVSNSSAWPRINLEEVEGGYALARLGPPEGVCLRLRSYDGSLSLVLPLENIEVFIDSRYFLLQERMGEFVERRGDICTWWGIMEYLTAWGGAWLNGNVELSSSRSRAFFETAWAIHEINTFGSSDYWAAAKGLIDAVGGGEANGLLTELNNRTILVTPVCVVDMDSMRGYIDRALGAIEGAKASLEETKRCVRLARNAAARLSENTENSGGVLENVWKLLGNAVENVAKARDEISDVGEQFNQLLEFITSLAPNNVMMGALYQSITSQVSDASYPSLKEQVRWGIEGTLAKLLQLGQVITNTLAGLDASGLEASLNWLFEQVTTSTEALLSEPSPLRWVTFESYREDPPQRIEERAPVYIDDNSGGTIGVLGLVLEEARGNLNEMKQLSQQYEQVPAELQEFDIDEELSSRLGKSPPEFSIGRENFYELLPPSPINPSPGLSVFHKFDVRNLTYAREDPAGRIGLPTATPIPLWFIGVTLWWGQWETTFDLEPGATEDIFDFDNPTLPRLHGTDYFHQPLAYRWEMLKEPFSIRVVVISLRPFTISS